MAAHESFATQSRQLHEQMRAQMRSEMPAGAPGDDGHAGQDGAMMTPRRLDAGTLLLMASCRIRWG